MVNFGDVEPTAEEKYKDKINKLQIIIKQLKASHVTLKLNNKELERKHFNEIQELEQTVHVLSDRFNTLSTQSMPLKKIIEKHKELLDHQSKLLKDAFQLIELQDELLRSEYKLQGKSNRMILPNNRDEKEMVQNKDGKLTFQKIQRGMLYLIVILIFCGVLILIFLH